MSKKYVRVRRVIIPILTALVLLAQSAPAFALELTTSDVTALAATDTQVEIVQAIPAPSQASSPVIVAQADPVIGYAEVDLNEIVSHEQAQQIAETLDLSSVDMSQFKDWQTGPWWYGRDSVKFAVGMGYMKGKDGTRIDGGGTVTEAEFITVLTRACLPKVVQDSYRAKAALAAGETASWFTLDGAELAAQTIGLLEGVNISDTPTKTPCTRAAMARLLANALEIRGEDTSSIAVDTAVKRMNDSKDIENSGQYRAIGVVIGAGLITGTGTQGNTSFLPNGVMDRASMCEVLYRLDNPYNTATGENVRTTVLRDTGLLGQPTPTTPTTPTTPVDPGQQTEAITIDMRTPTVPHRAPRAGDTVIRPDGTSVVLEMVTIGTGADEATILGWGQNVSPYLGTLLPDGTVVTEGTVSTPSALGTDDPLAKGRYIRDNRPGYEYASYWNDEWYAVSHALHPFGVKQDSGVIDSTGLFESIGGGRWIWHGPKIEKPTSRYTDESMDYFIANYVAAGEGKNKHMEMLGTALTTDGASKGLPDAYQSNQLLSGLVGVLSMGKYVRNGDILDSILSARKDEIMTAQDFTNESGYDYRILVEPGYIMCQTHYVSEELKGRLAVLVTMRDLLYMSYAIDNGANDVKTTVLSGVATFLRNKIACAPMITNREFTAYTNGGNT